MARACMPPATNGKALPELLHACLPRERQPAAHWRRGRHAAVPARLCARVQVQLTLKRTRQVLEERVERELNINVKQQMRAVLDAR